ncbi:low temperature requirement protein A [Streptomyces sp. SID12488]|uniref:low temperature requirement protein A n=1 Tax=Streptomyces sp. SID12488 TaxID=2706040 RepID=UPI0031BA38E7
MPDQPDASAGAGRDTPLRRLTARGRDESHRVASPLELFFDLCFVVAVAQAGVQLVHAVAEGHPGEGILNYAMVFFPVLGEAIAAATVAVKSGVEENDALADLLPIAAGGLLIVFAAWWIYFAVPIHGRLRTSGQAFLWGYGHYLIFASAAAIGAGLEVAVEQAVGKAHISTTAASAAVTLPTALFLVTVWALHSRYFKVGVVEQLTLPSAALLVIVCTFLGDWAVLAAGLVSALAVAAGVTLTAGRWAGSSGPKTRRRPGSQGKQDGGTLDNTGPHDS